VLALSRQKVPTFDRTRMGAASGLRRGAYVLVETPERIPDIILIASGSEVQLAVGAREKLEAHGVAVRVVSMPSAEIFESQERSYRDSVLPPSVTRRLAIEAGSPLSWYKWVGSEGDVIGMTTFGASAPYQELLKHFGFTVDNVVERALRLLGR